MPIWTLIRDDVRVDLPVDSLLDETEYKRYYKTSRGFSGKNVELFLGNFISLLARERVGAKKAFETLQQWECWPVISDHYAAKDMTSAIYTSTSRTSCRNVMCAGGGRFSVDPAIA